MPALTNLPVELTSFVGRGSDIDRVLNLLASSRLINLAGPGGVGKTRLAIHSALEASSAFPDGVWFIDLTSTSDGEVVSSLVAAIGTELWSRFTGSRDQQLWYLESVAEICARRLRGDALRLANRLSSVVGQLEEETKGEALHV